MIMINEHVSIPYQNVINPYKRISWTAIFMGALVGMGLTFLLGLFSTAIGLSAFNLSQDGTIVLAIGGLAGILIGIICSMLAGGYTAGYLGRLHSPLRNLGILYGFGTWTVALLLSALFAGQLSTYLTTYSDKISNSVLVVPGNKANATEQMVVKSTPTSIDKDQKTIKVTATPKSLASGAFIVFMVFLVGAISNCIGACWGMGCRRND
jgi:hypothetical protein